MSDSNVEYFDLHTTGLGYLGDLREVKPTNGQRFSPFWAVRLNAFHGPKDDVVYVYYDCKIAGSEALDTLKDLHDSIRDPNSKVLVHFKVGDTVPSPYEKNGETRVSLKSRLLKLYWVKVDGAFVYTATKSQTDGQGDTPQESSPGSQSDTPQESSPGSFSSNAVSQDYSQSYGMTVQL